MGVRQDFDRKILKKQQEIESLEMQLRDARSYLQALQDTMKMLPEEVLDHGSSEGGFRAGTFLSKSQEAIRKAGRPLHIYDLLKAIGKTPEKKNKLSLSGSIAACVRKKEIFTRPAPNTFGLIEFENQ